MKINSLISDDGWEALESLRENLFGCIGRILSKDGHCKSYEGAFAVHFPNYFETSDPKVVITLDCYLVGPSRHYRWEGPNLVKAVEAASRDIYNWIGEENDHLSETN